jgi:gliding motility-associated-like protein
LIYNWEPGTNSASTASYNLQGNFTVTVTNGCGDSSGPVPFFVDAIAPPTLTLSNSNPGILCNGATMVQTASPSIPSLVGNNYSITWSGTGVTANGNSATIGPLAEFSNETISATITNLCGSSMTTFNVSASVSPEVQNVVDAEVWPLCQRECKALSIIPADNYEDAIYEWTSTCAGLTLSSTGTSFDYCADNVPFDCLGSVVTITSKISNGCGDASAEWFIQTDECLVRIPNIFTPNGKGGNDTFFIEGLDKYTGSELMVYNRWGNLVYESTDYKNDWRAAELSEGNYWYVLKLPYGDKTEFTGTLQLLR